MAPVLRHRLRTVVATAACTDDSGESAPLSSVKMLTECVVVDGDIHTGRQLPENVFRRLHRRINRRVHCIDQVRIFVIETRLMRLTLGAGHVSMHSRRHDRYVYV